MAINTIRMILRRDRKNALVGKWICSGFGDLITINSVVLTEFLKGMDSAQYRAMIHDQLIPFGFFLVVLIESSSRIILLAKRLNPPRRDLK